nr:basic salivary proline-rich protein 1-like isoform X2 [Chelonoidis abingdonii]
MGLCYSLRPRLFGDPGGGGSISSVASEPEQPAEHTAPPQQPLGVPRGGSCCGQPGAGGSLHPADKPGGEADGPPPLLLQNGGGNGAAPERQPLPKPGGGKQHRQPPQPAALQRPWEKLRLEEREAEKEARKVSKSIDRALKEQKREYKQTHRLLLLVFSTLSECGREQ